jgi:subtilisin
VTKPAWSWQFESGTLKPATALILPPVISKEWAWGGSTGAGVKVAVVDSGIDGDHPSVGEVVGGVALEFDPDAEDHVRRVEGPHEDLFGHGTACAAIIKRVAPECELYSVRVLGARLTGKGVVFAAGLRWAVDNGMHVVNLSLSTGKQDYFGLFHEIADEAYFHNVMLVSAVNNIPAPSYPSQYSSVFSVRLQPGAARGVRSPGHRRRGGVAQRFHYRGHRQQLRGAAHRRAGGEGPGEAPRSDAVPDEDDLVRDRGQRGPGSLSRSRTGPASQPR